MAAYAVTRGQALYALIAISSFACEVEHLTLGSLPRVDDEADAESTDMEASTDAATLDAGEEPDVREIADAAGEAEAGIAGEFVPLTMVVDGVAAVTRVEGCAGDCVDVEVRAIDGAAPFTPSWQDGDGSRTRRLCIAAQETTFSVLPSRPAEESALSSLEVASIVLAPVACDGGTRQPVSLCYRPEVAPACSPTQEYMARIARTPPAGGDAKLSMYFSGHLLAEVVDLYGATGCDDGQPLTSFELPLLTPSIVMCLALGDAPLLRVHPQGSGTFVSTLEVCERCD